MTLHVPPGGDPSEFLAELGVTDGLPVVLPTKLKLRWMLTSTARDPSEILGKCPPSLSPVSVEQAAVNAIMAGCNPSQLPVVLAATEAMLDPKFNLHGVHATTMGATPCVIVNGPARQEAGINCGLGALGSGTRANACIGRALKLILQNVGGAKLGGTESTTIGTPAKFTMCLGEKEESLGSWMPYASTLDSTRAAGESWVTVRAVAGGPEQLVDFETRNAHDLIDKMACKAVNAWSAHLPLINEMLVVISPEHTKTLQGGGFSSKAEVQQALFDATNVTYAYHISKVVATQIQMSSKLPAVIKPILGHVLGPTVGGFMQALSLVAPFKPRNVWSTLLCSAWALLLLHKLARMSFASALTFACLFATAQPLLRKIARRVQSKIPKFSSPASFQIIVAGADAGKFSTFCTGFGMGRPPMPTAHMSSAVSRPVAATLDWSAVPQPDMTSSDLVDPRRAAGVSTVVRAPRKPNISGTIGLLDISKPGGSHILDRVQILLQNKFDSVSCKRYMKPMFSRPCPDDLRLKIASECDYVIEALAD